jgi:hypothetical protein
LLQLSGLTKTNEQLNKVEISAAARFQEGRFIHVSATLEVRIGSDEHFNNRHGSSGIV